MLIWLYATYVEATVNQSEASSLWYCDSDCTIGLVYAGY